MKTPLLFSRRRPVPVVAAAQVVGTDNEFDQKTPSDSRLKAAIRPLAPLEDARDDARGAGS